MCKKERMIIKGDRRRFEFGLWAHGAIYRSCNITWKPTYETYMFILTNGIPVNLINKIKQTLRRNVSIAKEVKKRAISQYYTKYSFT